MALAIGDPVGHLSLLNAHGEPVRLSEFRGEALLLIFLRHLA
jgi:peroxiredoxin